jgi:hypothetical protein
VACLGVDGNPGKRPAQSKVAISPFKSVLDWRTGAWAKPTRNEPVGRILSAARGSRRCGSMPTGAHIGAQDVASIIEAELGACGGPPYLVATRSHRSGCCGMKTPAVTWSNGGGKSTGYGARAARDRGRCRSQWPAGQVKRDGCIETRRRFEHARGSCANGTEKGTTIWKKSCAATACHGCELERRSKAAQPRTSSVQDDEDRCGHAEPPHRSVPSGRDLS